MTDTDFFSIDSTRGVVAVEGEDRQTFLQGLISNDTRRVAADRAVYSAFLTPQGKFLHDFCLVELEGSYLLDPEAERRADLIKRLSMYRLRSKVKIVDRTDPWTVAVFYGPGALSKLGLPSTAGHARPLGGGVVFVDPRLPDLGARGFLPRAAAAALAAELGFVTAPIEPFEWLQSGLGVPSGSRELPPEKAILLENGFEELGAINWDKGCYMGQELTARTRYRGLVRKRLLPVDIEGPIPAPGTALMLGETEVGELRSTTKEGDRGYAMIRLEHLARADRQWLIAGSTRIRPFVPDWMRLPEQVG